ncbi:MAG: hypothetical protein K5781_09865, partial [Nitrosopumilus sp.]|nr:hypothetical protein [Nitrosopumilus sp.]
MNKSIPIIIAVVIVGGIFAYAISPYFTESTIDEALPTDVILQPKKEVVMDETMMDETMMDETMMDETMMD